MDSVLRARHIRERASMTTNLVITRLIAAALVDSDKVLSCVQGLHPNDRAQVLGSVQRYVRKHGDQREHAQALIRCLKD